MLAYEDAPGPAASAHRPSSMAVPATQHSSASASRSDSQRKRASHAPTSSATSQNNENSFHGGQLPVRDVYSHPAALQFQHAHPRRVIPRFGPYLLLQTIGEGEFGKVKLGLHSEYGEEVAVKLIRRGSVDNTVRMSKVEREIDVLKVIRHPNIVRLFDVIETDKYIGIVLEYASGGELFDHILAHRCLKEKDACRLFAQLISGVAYIHAKKIVHRDLKLENLLLDRNRNVIISDFGFANRFEHKSDDLMQTSCGSPCYAAPELVISEGMYVGSAVDIWSCGVILYAMLAGYLPFDDDPANPDGDNINLLYKYIINTPLTFPDYISEEARDLLSRMLVPDPTHRATLQTIMDHRWLRAYRHFFDRSVDEHEAEAMLQHQQKREEYARKLRLKSATGEEDQAAAHHREHRERRHRERGDRTALADVTAPPSAFSGAAGASDSALASNPYVDQNMEIDSSQNAQRRAHAVSAIVMPTQRKRERSQPPADIDLDYPTSSVAQPAPAQIVPLPSDDQPREKKKRTKHADRHTIQVEYDDPEAPPARPPIPMPTSSATADVFSEKDQGSQPTQQRQRTGSTPPVAMLHAFNTSPKQEKTQLAPKERSSKDQASRESMPTPSSESRSTPKIAPIPIAPAPVVTTSSPVTTPSQPSSIGPQRSGSQRATNGKSSRARASLDRLGLGKVFGTQPSPEPAPLPPSVTPTEATATTSVSRSESLSTRPPTEDESSNQDHSSTADTTVNASDSGFSKIKRRTLNLVVGSGRSDRKVSSRTSKPVVDKEAPPASAIEPPSKANGHFPARDIVPPSLEHTGNAASTSKAKKVMDWFRTRSQTRGQPSSVTSPSTELLSSVAGPRSAAPQLVITTPRDGSAGTNPATAADSLATPTTPYIQSSLSQRIAHALTPTLRSNSSPIVANPVTPPVVTPPNPVMALRVHHGAVDQGTVTTGHPAEVFAHVRTVLQEMGMELQKESEYKYRCIRPKRKKAGAASASGSPNPGAASTPPTSPSGGVAAYTMVGSASLNGIDKRGLPHPSGMLRGLLTRRASSHISDVDDDVRSPTGPQALPATEGVDTIYGDRTVDLADEVRFSVELTRIDRLDDTLSLDIRRLKGNLRSYKFVYDTLRDRCAFSV